MWDSKICPGHLDTHVSELVMMARLDSSLLSLRLNSHEPETLGPKPHILYFA